jgi:hypothetical protein
VRPQTELTRCLIIPVPEPAKPPKGDKKRRRTWRDLMNPGVTKGTRALCSSVNDIRY